MAKITIEVDTITCLAPVIAEVGDRLMIFNGFCVGVNTAQHQTSDTPKLLTHIADRRLETSTSVEENIEKIIKALLIKPRNLGALAEAVNLTRAQVQHAATLLDKDHKLIRHQRHGTGIRRLYQLRATNGSTQP